MKRIPGIYRVTNIVNNKVYIGSSISCYDRWKQHRYELNNGTHVNSYLQRSWNKYGSDKFKFEIIEECSESVLKEREDWWITFYGGIDSDDNYNLMDARRNSPNEEVRKKISKARTGIKLSDETKRKLSEYNKAHPNPNFTNRVRTEEERKKISESLKGNKPWNLGLTKDDPRVAQNIEHLIEVGSNPSTETKQKISASIKQLHKDGKYDYEEATKKKLETMRKHKEEWYVRKTRKDKGTKKSPEVCKHISDAKRRNNQYKKQTLGYVHSDETREKIRQYNLANSPSRGKVWVHNNDNQLRIDKADLQKYLSNGYEKGMIKNG